MIIFSFVKFQRHDVDVRRKRWVHHIGEITSHPYYGSRLWHEQMYTIFAGWGVANSIPGPLTIIVETSPLLFTLINPPPSPPRACPVPSQMAWSKRDPNRVFYATTGHGVARYDLVDLTVEIIAHYRQNGKWGQARSPHSIVCLENDYLIWSCYLPDDTLKLCPFGLLFLAPLTGTSCHLFKPYTDQSEACPRNARLNAFAVCEHESCIYALPQSSSRILRLVYRIPDFATTNQS